MLSIAPGLRCDCEEWSVSLQPELKALIFDVDGTIAETERDGHRIAFNRTFEEAELPWSWTVELYGQLLDIAGGKERIRHYMEHFQPDFAPPEDVDAYITQLHALKTKHYRSLLKTGGIPPRPGVQRLIDEARSAGLRLAIATTSALPNAMAVLEQALSPNSFDWFEVIAAGDIVPEKKPSPAIYRYVLEAMQLDANECLAIEDSPQGLQAARAAGITTIVTVNDYTRDRDFRRAALTLDHLGEPDRPCNVIAGEIDACLLHLDIASLRWLHQRTASE